MASTNTSRTRWISVPYATPTVTMVSSYEVARQVVEVLVLPALSGVVKTYVLTLQRYEQASKLPNKSPFIFSCGIVSRDSLPKVFKYSSIQLGQEGFP
jgi:hypothetical protein